MASFKKLRKYCKNFIKDLVIYLHKKKYRKVYADEVHIFAIPRIQNRKNILIGSRTKINDRVFLQGDGGIEIKRNVTLSHGVTLLSTGYETANWHKNKYEKAHKPDQIFIENNVWVGANTTILAGVSVAEGIIIGAGSVVTQPLTESNALYAGTPACFIKFL